MCPCLVLVLDLGNRSEVEGYVVLEVETLSILVGVDRIHGSPGHLFLDLDHVRRVPVVEYCRDFYPLFAPVPCAFSPLRPPFQHQSATQ